MTNNPENIPSDIFDWMHSSNFASLHTLQKAEVEKYLSSAEYDELHAAMGLVQSGTKAVSSGKLRRKKELLHAFDAKYGSKQDSIVISASALWRAAAISLLLISGWMSYRLFNKNAVANTPEIAKSDTVYLQRVITSAPILAYDTIYLRKEVDFRPERKKEDFQNPPTRTIIISPGNDLAVLSAKDLKSTQNLPKKNSLKDDSMAGKFGFVSL